MATESTENILATIYRLTRKASYARTKDIAISLGVSQPTVSEKIVRLAEEGYLDHKWRKGAALTQEGQHIALRILRKHRLIELFLVKVLRYPIDEVNEEACRLEHAVSDQLIEAIDSALGFPKVDPHGHPIPTKEGAVEVSDHQSLAEAAPRQELVIKQVSDRDPNRLRYLRELGLVPGARISILDIAPFDGPLSLKLEGKTLNIGNNMAQLVHVSYVE